MSNKTNFKNLECSIAALIQNDNTNLENLEQYLATAMYWAKLAVLPPIFD